MLRCNKKFCHLKRIQLLQTGALIALAALLPTHQWMSRLDTPLTRTAIVAAVDQRKHDAADLVFKVNELRRTMLSVTGVVSCQSVRICVLELPAPMDDMISIGLENLSPDLQRHIILDQTKTACPERLTGFFDGVHLELTAVEFSQDSRCIDGPREGLRSSYRSPVPIGRDIVTPAGPA